MRERQGQKTGEHFRISSTRFIKVHISVNMGSTYTFPEEIPWQHENTFIQIPTCISKLYLQGYGKVNVFVLFFLVIGTLPSVQDATRWFCTWSGHSLGSSLLGLVVCIARWKHNASVLQSIIFKYRRTKRFTDNQTRMKLICIS